MFSFEKWPMGSMFNGSKFNVPPVPLTQPTERPLRALEVMSSYRHVQSLKSHPSRQLYTVGLYYYIKLRHCMSRLVTKPTYWHVRPAKTQISLSIRPVWSESSLCAQWVGKDPSFLHADSEDSDQTGRMPRLIWVFAGRTCHFVGFVIRRLIYTNPPKQQIIFVE